MLHPLSLVITALVLLPNLLFIWKKPVNVPAVPVREPVVLVIPERLGQFGCFLIPLFYGITISSTWEILAAAGMGMALAVYYAGWGRYLRQCNQHRLLFSPLWHIPVPMAVAPVLYFLLSAVILHAWTMALAALVLGAGHIPITLLQYRCIQAK